MISFTEGNLLRAEADALVNTVNTVGVMGKGIALMFKEHFPDNFRQYEAACKACEIDVGRMFVTEESRLDGPRWIINFPTKRHWRNPSKMEWIDQGLSDLKRVIHDRGITSIALPPLGSGNGGLAWPEVRERIVQALGDLPGVDVLVFEPTGQYQNVAKAVGVEKLTPVRALVAELVRRYSVLGIACSLLEIQKLAYFLDRMVELTGAPSLNFQFKAGLYGPYANRLAHLLDSLDGSYLHADKRIADARPSDPVRFDDAKRDAISVYLTTPEAKAYRPALEATAKLIDGFESPLGMELLATVDWLVFRGDAVRTVDGIIASLKQWPGGVGAGERKLRLFDARMIGLALEQLEHAV